MTKGEVSKHAVEIADREAAGEEVTTKRNQRSDKGKKRGKRTAKEVDGEDMIPLVDSFFFIPRPLTCPAQ
jgi:hypothetical protein